MGSTSVPPSEHEALLLGECVGRPARISFFRSGTAELLTRAFGGIDLVQPGEPITVDCQEILAPLPIGCSTVVEVMVRGDLIILRTTLARRHGATGLMLHWPDEVSTQQRRVHPRIDIQLPLHFIIAGSSAPHDGIMDNLSAGGLAFTASEHVDIGSEVTIAFGLGSGFYFNGIEATVLRCTPLLQRGYQVGVRFAGLHPDTFQNLHNLVSQRLAGPGNPAEI